MATDYRSLDQMKDSHRNVIEDIVDHRGRSALDEDGGVRVGREILEDKFDLLQVPGFQGGQEHRPGQGLVRVSGQNAVDVGTNDIGLK